MSLNRHFQITSDLRSQITSGTLAPGAQLPAETALMQRYRTSRPTIRTALSQLENEGLLVRFQGRGTFVRHRADCITYGSDGFAATNTALKTTISRRTVPADEDLAALLALPLGSELTEFLYVSTYLTDACALARIYVPTTVTVFHVPAPDASPIGAGVRQALAGACVHITETRTRVASRLPCIDEMHTLSISVGTPVLDIERVSTGADGNVVELARITLTGFNSEARFTEPVPALGLEAA